MENDGMRQLLINLPNQMYLRLRSAAHQNETNMTELARQAIDARLLEMETEQAKDQKAAV